MGAQRLKNFAQEPEDFFCAGSLGFHLLLTLAMALRRRREESAGAFWLFLVSGLAGSLCEYHYERREGEIGGKDQRRRQEEKGCDSERPIDRVNVNHAWNAWWSVYLPLFYGLFGGWFLFELRSSSTFCLDNED